MKFFGSLYHLLLNKLNRVRTTDAFWQPAGVLVSESSFKWRTFMFPMLFCSNSVHFSEIQLVCDGPTDGPTDGRTETPSYRDATAHLKIKNEIRTFEPEKG